ICSTARPGWNCPKGGSVSRDAPLYLVQSSLLQQTTQNDAHIMANPYRYALLTFLKLADLAVITVAFVLAVMTQLHQPQPWVSLLEMRIQVQNVLFLLVFLCYCHLLLRSLGLYRSHRLTAASREWRDLAGVAVVAAMSLYLSGRVLSFDYAKPEVGPAVACMMFLRLPIERRALPPLAPAAPPPPHHL